jgi:hypothetical protein
LNISSLFNSKLALLVCLFLFSLAFTVVIFICFDLNQHDIWSTTSFEKDNGDIFQLYSFCACLQYIF